MTSLIAPIGLTYASQDLQTVDTDGVPIIWLQITSGIDIPFAVRGHDVLVPGLPGLISRNRVNDHLDITLGGHVRGSGATTTLARADYRTQVRLLRELFAADRAPADLVATLEDGSTWTISARPADPPIIWGEEPVISEFRYLSVGLYSVAPDWTIEDAGS